MSELISNVVECSICYQNKTPYYSDNIGCVNYKNICIDCIPLIRSNECPFCREIHHSREEFNTNNYDENNSNNENITSFMQIIYDIVLRAINNNFSNNTVNNENINTNDINIANNAIQRANLNNDDITNIRNNNNLINNILQRLNNDDIINIINNNNNIFNVIERANLNNDDLNNIINNNLNSRIDNNEIDILNESLFIQGDNNYNFSLDLESILLDDNINIDNIDNLINNDINIMSDAIRRASIN